LVPPSGKTDAFSLHRERRGQQFFRQCVLNAYGVSCCITGIQVPRLLVASHIKPWSEFEDSRLDPCNGMCLSALHDAAFDSGLITLDEKLKLVPSKELKRALPQEALETNFAAFEKKPIRLPDKLCEPSQAFLRYHREEVFLD
jgi:putative restriction endonuclease